jgi:nucleoside permease NupC
MLIQFIIALFVLRTKAGFDIFSFVSELCRDLLGFANNGVIFLTDKTVPKLPWFLTSVVPPIIFFVSFVQLLFYYGKLNFRALTCAISRLTELSRRNSPVVHRQIRRLLLLVYARFWCRSGRCSCFAVHRTRRIRHAE